MSGDRGSGSASATDASPAKSDDDRTEVVAGPRPGRRPGESGARSHILAAARHQFAARGFDRATIRGIAAEAGVDPALVLHYFGSKEQLFGAALEIPLDPNAILKRVMAHDPDEMGTSLVRAFLEAWGPEETRSPLLAIVRSAMTNETAMALVREFLGRRIFAPLTATLGVADADLRATLIGSQLIGLAMVRYVARIEPMASAPVERIVAAAAPTIQRYLTGDLGAESASVAEGGGRDADGATDRRRTETA